MKTYSNDPQDYTLEDAYSDEFDAKRWPEMYEDLRVYMENNDQALDSFKGWWIEQQIKNHNNGNYDYLADQAWNDFNQ